MSLASDITSLESALALARATTLDPGDIVKLLDTAILTPIVEAGRIVARWQVNGRDVSMAVNEARELRKYYHELATQATGYGCLEVTL